jgi:hypothetical protein
VTEPDASPGNRREKPLPRRDWILLPALALLTICLLAASSELIARRVFETGRKGQALCVIINDSSTGVRGIPNCVNSAKGAESEWVEYKLNSCGHRAGMECGPKPPGTYRIVMIGSSVAMGDYVPREKSFAALLPLQLSRETSHKIELYNEASGWVFSHGADLRFNDALTQSPDLILWALTPTDIQRASMVLPTGELDPWPNLSLPEKAWKRLQTGLASGSLEDAASEAFGHTRTALMLRHFLYKSQSQYVKSFLASGDTNAGYLKVEQSAEWKKHLEQFDSDAADMEARAKAAGVPFVAVLLPDHAQAAMIAMGQWPQGYDPYKLDNELRAIIASHGGIYIDILPNFRSIPNAEQYTFPVENHPTPAGHAMLSELLARALSDGSVPALKAAPSHQPPYGQRR